MKTANKNKVYPVERADTFDSFLRRVFQNPRRILKPYIRPGMIVLDLGCGPGFFTVGIAKMLNGAGKVIAADLQEGMLDKVKAKISGTQLENKIELHKCEPDRIGLATRVDFILAFYVVHEIDDHLKLFEELKSILQPGGLVYIVEPSFHVSANEFEDMVSALAGRGFEAVARPGIMLSRTLLARKK